MRYTSRNAKGEVVQTLDWDHHLSRVSYRPSVIASAHCTISQGRVECRRFSGASSVPIAISSHDMHPWRPCAVLSTREPMSPRRCHGGPSPLEYAIDEGQMHPVTGQGQRQAETCSAARASERLSLLFVADLRLAWMLEVSAGSNQIFLGRLLHSPPVLEKAAIVYDRLDGDQGPPARPIDAAPRIARFAS